MPRVVATRVYTRIMCVTVQSSDTIKLYDMATDETTWIDADDCPIGLSTRKIYTSNGTYVIKILRES